MLTISVPKRVHVDWRLTNVFESLTDWHVYMLVDGRRQVWEIAQLLNTPLTLVMVALSHLKQGGLVYEAEILPAQATSIPPMTSWREYALSDEAIIRTFHARFQGFQVSRVFGLKLPSFIKDWRIRSNLKHLQRWMAMTTDQRKKYVYG